MSLHIVGLCSGYERLEVLHDLELHAAEGELVAVIGANGAGKTTLLRTVSGLLRATAGSVRLGERDLTALPAERVAAAGLAHVPENRLVFPTLSVADNLTLGAWTQRRRGGARDIDQGRERMYTLFPQLASRRAQPAGTMSGGEQQMLAVARGLMARPTVLVLDEPSLGLAPRVIAEIFAALAQLRDEGLTVLLVEQNARAALRIADRAYVLDRGRVLLEGPPRQLLDDSRVQAAYLGGSYAAAPAAPPAAESPTA